MNDSTTAELPYEVHEIEDFVLESGATLRPARLAYRTYGTLNADRSNAVLFPVWFAGTHEANEWLIGPGRALDPARWFIIVPNLFGNGLSSSPSNTPAPYDRARFPKVSVRDNVAAQHRLVTEVFGIERLALVTGCSMGALQTYQWAVSHPSMVERAAPYCGAAVTSPHNAVFLEGVRAALTTDSAWAGGWYEQPPRQGLRSFARVYAGWGLSQAFYWNRRYQELGFASLEDFLAGFWEMNFHHADANNLLTMLDTWQHADVGMTPGYGGDTERALGAIRARVLAMPSSTDLYFPVVDEEWARSFLAEAEVRPIPSEWGHLAGGGGDSKAAAFIDTALRELLEAAPGSVATPREPGQTS